LSTQVQQTKQYYWYALPGVAAFGTLVGGSFLYNIYLSFNSWQGIGKPEWIGLENYQTLIHDRVFWVSFLHAFEFIFAMSIAPSAIGLIIGALIYDLIARHFGNAISTFLRVSLYIPQIIALPVVGILWAWMLSPNIGVINTVLRKIGLDVFALNWLGEAGSAMVALSIMMIWIQVGYTVVIFISGMSRLDPYLDEAAQLDGATWFERFRIVTIPQLYPEIAVVLLTTTVAALKVFGPVYVMTNGGPGDATQVPAYFSYFHFFSTTRVGYGAAIATVLALLLTVLAISLLRLQRKLGLMR
jgi:raffinose/stachyose/melibiose transport system permease protein